MKLAYTRGNHYDVVVDAEGESDKEAVEDIPHDDAPAAPRPAKLKEAVVRPKLIAKDEIAPGPRADVPEVPESGRKRPRQTPSTSWKASGVNVEADKEWFMAGCPNDDGLRERRARMNDAGAEIA